MGLARAPGGTPCELSAPDLPVREISSPNRTWFPGFRSAVLGLLAYHAVVIAGALLAIRGILVGDLRTEYLGYVLIAAGVAIQVALIVWSVRLARQAAATDRSRSAFLGGPATPERPQFCSFCAWRGRRDMGLCPRCGRPLIRLTGAAALPTSSGT
jgi:hypothetical protein